MCNSINLGCYEYGVSSVTSKWQSLSGTFIHFHLSAFHSTKNTLLKKKKTKAKNQSHKPAVIIKYLSHFFFFFFYSSTHYLSHKGDEGNNGISMVTAHNCAFAQSCWLNCRKKKNYSLKSKWLTKMEFWTPVAGRQAVSWIAQHLNKCQNTCVAQQRVHIFFQRKFPVNQTGNMKKKTKNICSLEVKCTVVGV